MNIKRATLEDIPELIPLINTSFNNFNGQGPGWTHNANLVKGPRITPQNPHELITDGVTATILKYVDENGKILGCVKLELKLVSNQEKRSKKKEHDVDIYSLSQCQCQGSGDFIGIDTDNNNQSGTGTGTGTGYEIEMHCTSTSETTTTTQKVCYLKLLSVLPHMQGQNIGSHILDASEEWAKLNGCSIIEIDVVCRMVPLIEFYERRDYVRTGVVKPYKVRSDCSLLIDRMHMVFLEKVLKY